MLLYPDLLALLFLQLALSSSWTLAYQLPTLRGGNPSSKGSQVARAPTQRQQSGELSTTVLALGEPCGVYTLSCDRGLRCTPPLGYPKPLQALLQGRGVCSNTSGPSPSERPQPTATHPTPSEDLEKAPCRRLLNNVLKGLQPLVFKSDFADIYMPNCDKHGFFRKKQCRSSRGMHRGHCWCVDESGIPTPSHTSPEGTLICDNA
ncbi:insulin-like growth factor-binding protein 3 [Coregonus clupeaformis]|uniref:insulin-like growth factor-binding protein 3 n=1 Tax=Coregonus clupeaformis TaxID=59861 RepID=UPI001BDFB7BF|nr:insulin-like growth factor-binding protein 3 [Coregonus clupeaformis]